MESRDVIGFNKEIGQLLNCKVKILLKHKEDYYITGQLKGFSRNNESIVLIGAKDTIGNKFEKIVIHGSDWLIITLEETPFPMEGLYKRLKNIFPPGQVQFVPEVGAISIMGKINVTQKGVTGEGPLYERVKKIYDSYISEIEG
ncbi:MAG: Lsm family RNA-binding protein [Promethearchaeota archaeon]